MKTLALVLSALLLCPAASFADVTVQYASSSGGYRGMGASESSGTRRVSGAKSREDAQTRFTGAVMGRLGGKKDVAHILRVDLDKRWTLDLKKKTYVEAPLKFALPAADEDEAAAKDAPPRKEEKPTHRVKSARAEVKKTGETKTINGFKTAKWSASLVVVVEELATKKTAEYVMGSDVWATPWTAELRKAMEEEAKFAKAYLKKLGVDVSPQDQGRFGLEGARMLLGSSGPEVGGALSKLARELSSIEGYPVVTETTWRAPAPAAPPAAKGKKPAPEMEEDEDDGSPLSDAAGAGSIGGAAMGFLGGMAKKAAKKKVKQKVKEAVTPDAGKPAFSVRTEVKSVDVGPIPAEKFEIPEGFKKKG